LQLKHLQALTPQDLAPLARHYQLSDRETQVLLSTVQDQPRKAMARQLRLKPGTIDKICDRLHKKLGVEDRLQIAWLVFAFLQQERER
jgi:DNA-binding CsgD family transcriptional regulator